MYDIPQFLNSDKRKVIKKKIPVIYKYSILNYYEPPKNKVNDLPTQYSWSHFLNKLTILQYGKTFLLEIQLYKYSMHSI